MDARLKSLVLASLIATLTAIGAQIRIPMVPIPFTLQTLFVLLSGSILGPFWGTVSMLIYLALGLMGLPVFAGASGPGVVVGPTFGYLAAFPLCAFWVGRRTFSNESNNKLLPKTFLILIEGQIWIFVSGVFYLWLITNYYIGDRLEFREAAIVGFAIFVPSAIIKTISAAWITARLRKERWI
jgi:biotin transport system substrate-specific component